MKLRPPGCENSLLDPLRLSALQGDRKWLGSPISPMDLLSLYTQKPSFCFCCFTLKADIITCSECFFFQIKMVLSPWFGFEGKMYRTLSQIHVAPLRIPGSIYLWLLFSLVIYSSFRHSHLLGLLALMPLPKTNKQTKLLYLLSKLKSETRKKKTKSSWNSVAVTKSQLTILWEFYFDIHRRTILPRLTFGKRSPHWYQGCQCMRLSC